MVRLFLFPLLLLLAACGGPRPADEAPAPTGKAEGLLTPKELTGGTLRAVWIRETGDGTDWHGAGPNLKLMGFDSTDGRGVRVLHEGRPNYNKPLLSPDGQTIVFTDLSDGVGRLMRMPWGGTDPIPMGAGLALDVWKAPDGSIWVYAGDGPMDYRGNVARVFRFPLDDPEAHEVVWDHKVARDNFQLGRSGKYAGGLFPAAEAGGVVDLETLDFNVYASGCWGSLSPGPRGLLWIFDGRHRNLLLFASDTSWLPDKENDRWRVNITAAEGIDGRRVYYPRWSNHSRFFAVSGPMSHGAYEQADIYVGRFAEDYRSVEAWTRLTDDDRPDLYPDVRVVPSADGKGSTGSGGMPGSVDIDPADVFQTRGVLLEKTRTPTPKEVAPYRRALAAYRYRVEQMPGGEGPGEIMVAHWVIRNGEAVRSFRRNTGETYPLALVPYDGNPAFEGERVVSSLDLGAADLYVDMSPDL